MAGLGFKKNSPGCKCCCPSKILVHVTKCGGNPVSGATINATGPGGPYGPFTADGNGNATIAVGTNCGTFNVTYTSGGFSGNQNVHVPCGGCQSVDCNFFFAEKMCNHVFGCSGAISGVSITGGGASCTTDASGNCCLNFTSNQTFPLNLTATLPTGPVRTVSTDIVNCTCSVHGGGPVSNCWQFIDKQCVTVLGCNGKPVSGATVSWSTGGTCTTSAGGTCCYTPTSDISLTGNVTITVSDSSCNFADASLTTQGQNTCNQIITMQPKPGYICCQACTCAIRCLWNMSDANGAFQVGLGGGTTPFTGDCVGAHGRCYSAPSPAVWQQDPALLPGCVPCCTSCTSGMTKVSYGLSCTLDQYGNPALILVMTFNCANCRAILVACDPCNLPFGHVGLSEDCSQFASPWGQWQAIVPLNCSSPSFSATPPATAPSNVAGPNGCPQPDANCPVPTVGTITGSPAP